MVYFCCCGALTEIWYIYFAYSLILFCINVFLVLQVSWVPDHHTFCISIIVYMYITMEFFIPILVGSWSVLGCPVEVYIHIRRIPCGYGNFVPWQRFSSPGQNTRGANYSERMESSILTTRDYFVVSAGTYAPAELLGMKLVLVKSPLSRYSITFDKCISKKFVLINMFLFRLMVAEPKMQVSS